MVEKELLWNLNLRVNKNDFILERICNSQTTFFDIIRYLLIRLIPTMNINFYETYIIHMRFIDVNNRIQNI